MIVTPAGNQCGDSKVLYLLDDSIEERERMKES